MNPVVLHCLGDFILSIPSRSVSRHWRGMIWLAESTHELIHSQSRTESLTTMSNNRKPGPSGRRQGNDAAVDILLQCTTMLDRHIRRLAVFIVAFGSVQLILLSTRPPSNLFYNNDMVPGHFLRPSSSSSSSWSSNSKSNKRNDRNGRIGNGIHLEEDSNLNSKKMKKKDLSTTHAIPKILVFTHYKDLLHLAGDRDEGDSSSSSSLSSLNDEEQVLAANIKHSIELHPDVTQVRFLTDKDCIQSLQNVYPTLIPFFVNETEGMYKGDICRGAALMETGGIYLDVDVGVRHDLWRDLKHTTEFVTVRVHRQSKYPGHFFQAMMGATPRNPVLLRYLQLFEKHYVATARGDKNNKDRIKKGPLGVILLKRAWDDVNNKGKTNDKNEGSGSNNNNLNVSPPLTELYQEVLYHPDVFPSLHPAPTWGSRRACHFVVVAKLNHRRYKEMTTENGIDIQIPLYSRIAGSRMCPI
jgi:Glycosyltransferase sugar-binding region containing DXD motif